MIDRGKVVCLVGKNKVETREYQIPDVEEDSILISVGLSGICGTDLHNINNADSPEVKKKLPIIPGHEVCGRIEKIGKKANNVMIANEPLKEGDRIIFYFALPCANDCWWNRKFGLVYGLGCGICPNRSMGRLKNCEEPPHFIGGWAEYQYIQPGSWIWKIPDDMPCEVAVLTEPFSMGIRAVEKSMSLPGWKNEQTLVGGTVVILGSRAIGFLTAIAARIAGAGKIILVGSQDESLRIAKELGIADYTLSRRKIDTVERIQRVRSLTPGGYGADVVFEAAGTPAAFIEGLEMVRKLGAFVELGNFVDTGITAALNIAKLITRKELVVYGVATQPPQYFEKSLTVLHNTMHKIDYRRVVTAKFKIEDAAEALKRAVDPVKKGIKLAFMGPAYYTSAL